MLKTLLYISEIDIFLEFTCLSSSHNFFFCNFISYIYENFMQNSMKINVVIVLFELCLWFKKILEDTSTFNKNNKKIHSRITTQFLLWKSQSSIHYSAMNTNLVRKKMARGKMEFVHYQFEPWIMEA